MLEDDPEISVVGEASAGKELRLPASCGPEYIVMDRAMPN